jgi:hypothetical protein
MTPKFWKYLITNCDGSAVLFVAESDREWAEKELEGRSAPSQLSSKTTIGLPRVPLSCRNSSAAAATDTARP